MQLGGLHVDAGQQLHLPRAARSQLDAGMEQRIRQLVGLAPEDLFGADVEPQRTDFLRHQEFDRLEREVLANDLLAAEQVFVAEMRALVIQLGAEAEAVAAERQRKPDDVVGVDQIVRRRAQVELGEDAADDVELEAFQGSGPPTRSRPKLSPTPTEAIDVPSPLGSSSERNVPRRKLTNDRASFGSAISGQKI